MSSFSSASQINILLIDGSTTIVLPIGKATIPGQVGTTGSAAGDAQGLIASIFKLGYFWDPTQTTLRPVSQIKSITYV